MVPYEEKKESIYICPKAGKCGYLNCPHAVPHFRDPGGNRCVQFRGAAVPCEDCVVVTQAPR